MTPARIPLLTDRLTQLGIPDASGLCPTLDRAHVEAYLAVVSMDQVDAVTSELVRLRNAEAQDCRLCKGLRNTSALRGGLTEELVDTMRNDASALPGQHAPAIELADAFLAQPPGGSTELVGRLQEQLGHAAVAEIVLDMLMWTNNKVNRALGIDLSERRVQIYDPLGNAVDTDAGRPEE